MNVGMVFECSWKWSLLRHSVLHDDGMARTPVCRNNTPPHLHLQGSRCTRRALMRK